MKNGSPTVQADSLPSEPPGYMPGFLAWAAGWISFLFPFLNIQCSAPWHVGKVGPPGKSSVSTTVTTWSVKVSATQIISQKLTRSVPCHHALSGPQTQTFLRTLSWMRTITPGASALAAPTCSEEISGGQAPGERWVFPQFFPEFAFFSFTW